jgi:hypothetical protein
MLKRLALTQRIAVGPMRTLLRRWPLLLALAACDAPDTDPAIPIDLPDHFAIPEGAERVELEIAKGSDDKGCRSRWRIEDEGTPVEHAVLPIGPDVEAWAMEVGGAYFLEHVRYLRAELPTGDVLYVFCDGVGDAGNLARYQAWSLGDTLTLDMYFERKSFDDDVLYGGGAILYLIDTQGLYNNYDARYLGDFEGDGQ